MSEDCLYLNIWTPASGKKNAHLPVMVWIHGGAFQNGFGHEIEFDGDAYAKKGIILVTLNYRLGMCGFLSHPLLTAENSGKGSGNYGLFDQLAALKWIKRNIEVFGGNPNNVTVFGQSAGAGSVQALISSPLAKGYVQRAIIQSGGGLGGIISTKSLQEAETMGKAMWDASGYDTLEQMRTCPVEHFQDPASSERFRAMAALAAKGIYTGVTMMPLLPLINDTRENVEAIVRRAKDAGASYILPMFGVTLRSGSREHFHATLDREFPGLKARYEACFGNRYECFSPSYRKLDDTFRNLCAKLGLETRMRFYAPTLPEQGSLF